MLGGLGLRDFCFIFIRISKKLVNKTHFNFNMLGYQLHITIFHLTQKGIFLIS